MPKHKYQQLPVLEKLSIKVTDWMGTVQSLVVHAILFAATLLLILLGVNANTVMLVLTTAISMEAIFLSLLIQMTVNRHSQSLKEVEKDIDEIQEDVEDIGDIKDEVADISEDLEELQEADSEDDRLELQQDAKTLQTLETIEQHMTVLSQNFSTIKEEINSLKSSYSSSNPPNPTIPPSQS